MTSPGQAARRRGDVDARISAAVLELLRSRGPLAVTIEAVAAESGVAKTTIYRRYRNREALLAAVVDESAAPQPIPAGLDARDTIAWVLRNARDTIEDVIGRGTIAGVLMGADREATEPLLRMIRTTAAPLRDHLSAWVADGQVRADLDIELAMSVVLGVVVAELIRDRPTDEAWVEATIAMLWPAFAPPGA